MDRNAISLCFFGILCYFAASIVARVAIIGGQKATEHQFPYQVLVEVTGRSYYCGGAIIESQFILTSAHCVVNDHGHLVNTHIKVKAGTILLTSSNEVAKVKKIYVPKDFDGSHTFSIGDIAVLKLEHPLKWSESVKKVNLPRHPHENYHGKIAIIPGFGWDWISGLMDHGNNSDGHLRFAEAEVLSRDHPAYHEEINDEHQLSAKLKNHHPTHPAGTCYGDSGGPLVHDNIIIGILMIGPDDCDEIDDAAVYTRVSRYTDFIHNAIHEQHLNTMKIQELH